MKRRSFLRALAAGPVSLSGVTTSFAAITNSPLLIGQSAAFTGTAAAHGKGMRDGILAAFGAFNAAGGLSASGRKVELRWKDDGYDPARTKANTSQFLADGAFGLIGYVGTPTSIEAIKLIKDGNIPFVGALSGAKALRTMATPSVFNVRASYEQEGPAIVRQLTSFDPNARVALFVQNDSYGQSVSDSVTRALAAVGLAPVTTATVERNSLDVAKAVDQIYASGATAVAGGSLAGPSAALMEGLSERGRRVMFASVSFVGTTALAKCGDSARGCGVAEVMPYPWSTSLQIVREYQQAMVEAGTALFSYESLEGYIAARTFLLGLERCGQTVTRERFIRALESIGVHDFGGFSVEFSPTSHNGSRRVELAVIGPNGEIGH